MPRQRLRLPRQKLRLGCLWSSLHRTQALFWDRSISPSNNRHEISDRLFDAQASGPEHAPGRARLNILHLQWKCKSVSTFATSKRLALCKLHPRHRHPTIKPMLVGLSCHPRLRRSPYTAAQPLVALSGSGASVRPRDGPKHVAKSLPQTSPKAGALGWLLASTL